jgi:hypothetical protein
VRPIFGKKQSFSAMKQLKNLRKLAVGGLKIGFLDKMPISQGFFYTSLSA